MLQASANAQQRHERALELLKEQIVCFLVCETPAKVACTPGFPRSDSGLDGFMMFYVSTKHSFADAGKNKRFTCFLFGDTHVVELKKNNLKDFSLKSTAIFLPFSLVSRRKVFLLHLSWCIESSKDGHPVFLLGIFQNKSLQVVVFESNESPGVSAVAGGCFCVGVARSPGFSFGLNV